MEDEMEMEEENNYEDAEEEPEAEAAEEMQQMDASDEEGEPFDISITATHSYMGGAMEAVRGRTLVEAGWRGRVPALPHAAAVFPGETVPLLLLHPDDARLIARALAGDKLFGLLFTEEASPTLSGYGVLCEVFEAADGGGGGGVSAVKARALVRVACARAALRSRRAAVRPVRALPERPPRPPLRAARPAALDPLRRGAAHPLSDKTVIRRMDAAMTPWPMFVYDMFDYKRIRATIQEYFDSIGLGSMLPAEPVALSFWVARNLAASARDRLALFAVDCALLRLHLACDIIAAKGSVLCCVACGAAVSRREQALAMSSEGARAQYTNPGGVLHEVLTVRRAARVAAAGRPQAQYSWFPGYAWQALQCARCGAHVGWRFSARLPALRPRAFYALCTNYVAPRAAALAQQL